MTFAVLCSGQGAQYADMLLPLQDVDTAQPILKAFAAVTGLTPTDLAACAPDDIFANRLAQPLICTFQLAQWRMLREIVPVPTRVFAGYSIGELAAYGCADALDPAATIALAHRRAALMDDASREPAGMIAVRGLAHSALMRAIDVSGAEIAIVNGADRSIVGGSLHQLQVATAACLHAGAQVTPLRVAVASHTGLLRAAVAPFRQALDEAGLRNPVAPVLAGVDGVPVYKTDRAKDVLTRQITQPLNWRACLDALPEMGCRAALELGPGRDLARMARDQVPDLDVRAVADFRSLDGAADWVIRHAT